LELVLKKGIVETEELEVMFDLKNEDLDNILVVLLKSGLVKLDRRTYLAPTPQARVFMREGNESDEDDEMPSGG